MATADALIAMTAQYRGAAPDDGIEYLAMRPCKVRRVPFRESVARSRGRCQPPRGWAGSPLHQPPGPLHFIEARHLDGFERTAIACRWRRDRCR